MSSTEPSDDDLMMAFAAGDQAAFARLYDRYRGRLYRYFKRQLAAAEADDCFQSLWLKVIDQAGAYRPAGVFDRYLFTLAHNVLVDQHRKRGRLAEVFVDDVIEHTAGAEADGARGAEADGAEGAAGPELELEREELRERLHTLLRRLPFHQREAWILKQEAAMSIEEIATITRTSLEGVRSRLRYATGKLKAGLARHV